MTIKRFLGMSALIAALLSSSSGSFVFAKSSNTGNVATSSAATVAPKTDEELVKKVSQTISRYVYYDIFDWIQVQVNNGVVIVNGAVHQPFHKTDILKKVQKVAGVQSVVDQITVLPVSPNDNRLRFNLARRIYNQPMLQRYALGPHPSIHIVVDNGTVTLQGVVDTQADKHVAEILARESRAFKVVDNLQVES